MDKDILIKVCTGTGGVASGSKEVLETFKETISSAGIAASFSEKCSAQRVGCRGFCAQDVLVDVIINGDKKT
jgi:NADH:ubiquinone oxidoreductase subunit E